MTEAKKDEKVAVEVQQENEQVPMKNEYKLYKPIEFEGKKYESLDLDFDTLSGNDLAIASREATMTGEMSMFVESTKAYQAAVVARAAKVPIGLISKLHAKDYTKVTVAAYGFLTN